MPEFLVVREAHRYNHRQLLLKLVLVSKRAQVHIFLNINNRCGRWLHFGGCWGRFILYIRCLRETTGSACGVYGGRGDRINDAAVAAAVEGRWPEVNQATTSNG